MVIILALAGSVQRLVRAKNDVYRGSTLDGVEGANTPVLQQVIHRRLLEFVALGPQPTRVRDVRVIVDRQAFVVPEVERVADSPGNADSGSDQVVQVFREHV